MRPASGALINLLHTQEQYSMVDLFTFTLLEGGVLRYSSGQSEILLDGFRFFLGPRIERGKTKLQTGTQVDELELTVYPEVTDLVGGVSFMQAAWSGQFDGANVQLNRAFMGPGGYGDTSPGSVLLFLGRVSDVQCGRTSIVFKVMSMLELLNIQMPRRVWQAACTHVFGQPMCGFNRITGQNALGASTGRSALTFSAAAGSTPNQIFGVPNSDTPFILGTIVGISGANTGYSRMISTFTGGVSVTVKLSFLFPITPGDQFQILPGCDRTQATCTNVFQNQSRFGGFRYIPPPETAA